MNGRKQQLGSLACILFAVGSFSAGAGPNVGSRHESGRCRHRSSSRIWGPQGTLLWGTRPSFREGAVADERASVLVSANLGPSAGMPELRNGHLTGKDLVGSILQGEGSVGQSVEVVICDAEPSSEDPNMVWYQIEAWNSVAKDWENPCVATGAVPNPRALVLSGTWDATGAHHANPRKITFACETGALGKCAAWGYKPWASVNGKAMADLHQACTRMVRADYCGNGKSHTKTGTRIDYYDSIGVASRTTHPVVLGAEVVWDPALASFEAAWAPDGASCLSRTREGQPLEEVLQECPGRFKTGNVDLGAGDQCLVQRSTSTFAQLRNRSKWASAGSTASASLK